MFCRILITFAALGTLAASSFAGEPKSAKRPNIILIMADDLGWGELGCYGQTKIKTPRIDRMAKEGIRFTQFYTGSPVCAPSRCVLMTGLHSGHAFIRDNRQAKPKEEGQLPVPADTLTVAARLKSRGYRTGLIGKWGLGMFGTSGDPLKLGFDNFFGYNCQAHAHSFYPTYLYRQDKKFEIEGNNLKSGKHSHDMMDAEAVDFIRKNRDGPFFLYLALTLPHLALQIPEADLAPYKGAFPETPYDGKQGYQPHPTPRAAYAAMVTRVDRTVGVILDLLKELDLDENTIVLFTSDNGATHLNVGGADSPFFRSMGPLRGFKGSIHEGGLRTPMIVRWPGRIPADKTSDHIGAFQDVMPTLCQIAGAETPKKTDGISFLPTLLGKGEQPTHPHLYFEFAGYGGQQGVRMGPWKATRVNMQKGNLEIELFNLDKDLGQTKNVAADHPDIMARIERILREEHVPSPEFPLKAIDGKKELPPKK